MAETATQFLINERLCDAVGITFESITSVSEPSSSLQMSTGKSQSGLNPYVILFPENCISETSLSALFTKEIPLSNDLNNAPFSYAIVSIDPNPSKWAGAMFVIIPCVGFANLQRASISPGALAPISKIEMSWLFFIPRRVRGRPIFVLKFPSVACILNVEESTCDNSSLVEVFPFDPVMPITGISNFMRHLYAISEIAFMVLGTFIC